MSTFEWTLDTTRWVHNELLPKEKWQFILTMQRKKMILFFSVLNLQTVWVFLSLIICQWSKHSGIFRLSETNDLLAPPGALIAIPTYYWAYELSVLLLGSTHFFAKYGAFSPEIKMSNNLLNGCEYWSIDFCNEIELIGKQCKTMRNRICREISFLYNKMGSCIYFLLSTSDSWKCSVTLIKSSDVASAFNNWLTKYHMTCHV